MLMRDRWGEIKYFERSEFDSPDSYGSGDLMDYEFIKLLDKARGIAQIYNYDEGTNIVFSITSGYRTKEYNSKLSNSSKNSSHLKGLAADIRTRNGIERRIILNSLIQSGLNYRIGIGSTFIHVDLDKSKVKSYWTYFNNSVGISMYSNSLKAYFNKKIKWLKSRLAN